MSPAVFGRRFHDARIDEAPLAEISEIQRGLPLSDEERQQAIVFPRLSPLALLTALSPIPMIVESRRHDEQPDALDRCCVDRFLKLLGARLRSDFRRRELAGCFFGVRRVRELETLTAMPLKDVSGAVVEASVRERTGIAQADETLGGGPLHVDPIRDLPEPWEEGGAGSPKTVEGIVPATAAPIDREVGQDA